MIWGTFVTLSEETDCTEQQVSLIYHSYLLMPRSMVCILCWLGVGGRGRSFYLFTWINWVIWQSRQSLKVVLCLLVVAGHSRKPVRIGMPRCLFRIMFLHALVGLDVYFMLQMSQLVVPNVLDSNYRKISFSICYKRIFFLGFEDGEVYCDNHYHNDQEREIHGERGHREGSHPWPPLQPYKVCIF